MLLFFFFLAKHIWGVFVLSRKRQQVAVLEKAIDVYTSEFERFIKFMGYLLLALMCDMCLNLLLLVIN